MMKENKEFCSNLCDIKRSLNDIEEELKKNKEEEREAIKKVQKDFDEKQDLILKKKWKIEKELFELQKKCPNSTSHDTAKKKNRVNGSGYTCPVCGYHIYECDERL